MKVRAVGISLALVCGSAVYAVAGSAASGAQIAPTDNAPVSTYKVTQTDPGGSVRDSAASGTTQAASSVNAQGASSSSFSSTGSSASTNGNSATSGSGSSNAPVNGPWRSDLSTTSGKGKETREKIFDTGDKPVDQQKAAKVEAKDRTFAPVLLDSVSDPSHLRGQTENATSSGAKHSPSKSSTSSAETGGSSKN